MKKRLICIAGCFTFFLLLIALTGKAQNSGDSGMSHIKTKDGNGYTGKIEAVDSLNVLFRDQKLGEITISKSEITNLDSLSLKIMRRGTYWSGNPQSTSYFFTQGGYGLKKGEGYYQNLWVLANSFAVGLNDYLSLGGGVIPLFLFNWAPTPVWLTAKLSVPVVKDKMNLGAGVMAGNVLGTSKSSFGIFYGITTFGSRDRNFSIGLGYGFTGSSGSSAPMIHLNGLYRISLRSYLLTENYYFPDGSSNTLLLMFGARQIIREAGLDYGLVFPAGAGINSFVAIPWLGITIPFGKRP